MATNSDILARLEEKAQFHEAQAQAYRAAAELVRAEMGAAPTRAQAYAEAVRRVARREVADPKRSTIAMIQTVLAESDAPLDISTLTERMLTHGWETTSEAPSNTVRTAVSRLVVRGEVTRTDGRYWIETEDEEGDSGESG